MIIIIPKSTDYKVDQILKNRIRENITNETKQLNTYKQNTLRDEDY